MSAGSDLCGRQQRPPEDPRSCRGAAQDGKRLMITQHADADPRKHSCVLPFQFEEDELRDLPLLVFANKQDLPRAVPAGDVTEALKLSGTSRPVRRRWRRRGGRGAAAALTLPPCVSAVVGPGVLRCQRLGAGGGSGLALGPDPEAGQVKTWEHGGVGDRRDRFCWTTLLIYCKNTFPISCVQAVSCCNGVIY